MAWFDMTHFESAFTDAVPASTEAGFTSAGIRTVHGHEQFEGATSLRVGDQIHDARHVVIAAGARHAPLGIWGGEHLQTFGDKLQTFGDKLQTFGDKLQTFGDKR